MKVSNQDMMFQSYPDVLNVKDLQNALEIGRLGAYKLLKSGALPCFKIGNTYKIPKAALIEYVDGPCKRSGVSGNDGDATNKRQQVLCGSELQE